MKLFEPLKIRNVTIHNRIYMLAMSRWNPGPFGGMATAYFARRARGGLGMLSTGIVQPETWWKTDELADELARFTDAIHTANPQTKVAIQPAAGVPGKWTSPSGAISKATHDSLVWGQSRMPSPEPVAITKEEIKQNVEKLAESCHLQERAGFDYVELHGTHGYLFRQFFSPLDNHREDEYGGSLENRMRFPLEAVRAIRAAVSDNFLIMYKMPYLEEEYGGVTPDDACRFAIELEKAGVDILTVTQGVNSHPRGYVPSVVPVYNYLPPGCFVDYAAAIKKRVNIAVAAAGRINKPELAESILQQGQADIIGLGRQIMADPDWPNKVYSGAWGNIRYCLSCNNCLDWTYPAVQKRQGTMACTINPELTYERERKIVPADKKKKVMVIGGGPGGMEAAWVAAERGHDVTLYERSESLGGQLIAAAKPPNKEQFEDYRRYLTTELRRTGVNVKLGQAATLSTVRREKPDAIVVATGSAPRRLDIPGVRGRNVAIADDVLTGKAQVGERVLVVGGGLVGMETAEWLVAQGKVVTLVEILDEIGKDIFPLVRGGAVQKVKELGVLTYVNSYPEEITEDGARINVNGTSEFMKFDSVVIAVGRQSENSLAKQMEGKAPEVLVIGDTNSPRRIRDAVWEGYEVATKL